MDEVEVVEAEGGNAESEGWFGGGAIGTGSYISPNSGCGSSRHSTS